nr:predicted protein [Haemonchus contortus]
MHRSSVGKAFGVATLANEFLMENEMKSVGSEVALPESSAASEKIKLRSESALLHGSIGFLTPRAPESEQTATLFSDIPVLRNGVNIRAVSEETIDTLGKMECDGSSETVEMVQKIGDFRNVSLSGLGSRESEITMNTGGYLKTQEEAATQTILADVVKDWISLMSSESAEEVVNSLWGTYEVEADVTELLEFLTKHEHLAEIGLIKAIVLKEKDKLSVGATRTLNAALAAALEKSSDRGVTGATLAAKLLEEASTFVQSAKEEYVHGIWKTVSSTADARSQWPEHSTIAEKRDLSSPGCTSFGVEATLERSPHAVAEYRKGTSLKEAVERIFYTELERAQSELLRRKECRSGSALIPIPRMGFAEGTVREHGQVEACTSGVVGTIQQPGESRDSVESIQPRCPLIQMIYSTKATSEEHTELLASLERFREDEYIEKILKVLKTEQLQFSAFASRTLCKVIEQELHRTHDVRELAHNVASAVKTVLSLTVKEVVDENAFAIIRSLGSTSETSMLLILSSVEKLLTNMQASSELREQVSPHIIRALTEATSNISVPVQTTETSGRKFTIEEKSLTQGLGLAPRGEESTRTLPKVREEEITGVAREYGHESVVVQGALSVIDQPIQQQGEVEKIAQRSDHLQFLHSTQATSEEKAALVNLLSKYQDDENVAAVIQHIAVEKVVLSKKLIKEMTTSVERELSKSPQTADISARVADVLRCCITEALTEIVDENAFCILRTKEVTSTAALVSVLSLLDSAKAQVRAPKQEAISSDTALLTEPSGHDSAVFPLQSESAVNRNFAVSAEILHVIQEQVTEEGAAARTLRHNAVERAQGSVQEQGMECANISASYGVLPQKPEQEEVGIVSATSKSFSIGHDFESSREERVELVKLLEKFQENDEVSKIIRDLVSEEIKFSRPMVQSMLQSIKDLQKTPDIGCIEWTVVETLQKTILGAVKHAAEETAAIIVESLKSCSTANLAVALTASEFIATCSRAVEQAEICVVSGTDRCLSRSQASIWNLVQLLRKYDDDEDVAGIVRDLISGRVSFSGHAIETVTAAVEKEVNCDQEASDVSRRVSEALRSAISANVKQIAEENASILLETKEVASIAQLAVAIAALESQRISVRSSEENAISTDTDLTQRARSSQELTLPIRGMSKAERQFAISTEVIASILEKVGEHGATDRIMSRSSCRQYDTARHLMKGSTNETAELVELLTKYQSDAEVSKIIDDLRSNKLVLSSSLIQATIQAVEELENSNDMEVTVRAVAKTVRDVVSEVVEQKVRGTFCSIEQSMSRASTANLALTLSTSEALMSHLWAVEPEEHRPYMQERSSAISATPRPPYLRVREHVFEESQTLRSGSATSEERSQLRNLLNPFSMDQEINEVVQFLDQESVQSNKEVTRRMINSIEEVLSKSTELENVALSIVGSMRAVLNETIKELTDEATLQLLYSNSSSSVTTMLVTLRSLESAFKRISESTSEQAADALALSREVAESCLVSEKRRQLQLLHLLKASAEERKLLIKYLARYKHHSEIEEVLKIVESTDVELSHRTASQIISVLEMNQLSSSEEVLNDVVDKIRKVLIENIKEITEEKAYGIWHTVEPTASLGTLLMTLISTEKIIENVVTLTETGTSAGCRVEDKVKEEIAVKQPSDQVVLGTWQPMQTQAFAGSILGEWYNEVERMQSAVQASQSTAMQIEQDLAKTQEHVVTSQKQIDSKQFRIANETQTIPFEKSATITSDSVSIIPEASKSSTVTQVAEFGSEFANVLSTHGYVQPKLEEEAEAELLIKRSRGQTEATTVSATRMETTERETKLSRTDEQEKVHVTSAEVPVEGSILAAQASRKEDVSEMMTLQNAVQKGDIERIEMEKVRLEEVETVEETRDENAYGVWNTQEKHAKTSTLIGLPVREEWHKSLQASTEDQTSVSREFRDSKVADTLGIINLERNEFVSRAFVDEKRQSESMLQREDASASSSFTVAERARISGKAEAREFGVTETTTGGALGFLYPRNAESAEVATELTDIRRLRATSSVPASSETSVELAKTISCHEPVETAFDQKVLSNQAQTVLSAVAATEDFSEVVYRKAKGAPSHGIAMSLPEANRMSAGISSKEVSETSVYGIWDSVNTKASSQTNIQSLSLESMNVKFSASACSEDEVQADVNFEAGPVHDITSVLPVVQKEGGSRQFNIENQQIPTTYQRSPQEEVFVVKKKDIATASSSGKVREFNEENAEMGASLGFIETRLDEFDGASAKIDVQRKLGIEQKVKATEDVKLDESLDLRKDESAVESIRVIQEALKRKEEKATRATSSTTTSKDENMCVGHQTELAGVRLKEKLSQACEMKVRESSEQQVQGLWRCTPATETSITLKEREKSVERGLLSTVASEYNEVSHTEAKTRDLSDSVHGILVDQQQESVVESYGIASTVASAVVRKPDSQTSVSERLDDKTATSLTGVFRELTNEEVALGIFSQTIQPPRDQFEGRNVVISSTNTVRLQENLEAPKECTADQTANLIKEEGQAVAQHRVVDKQEVGDEARMKAAEVHQIVLGIDKTNQEHKEGNSVLLTEITRLKGILTAKEIQDETAAATLTTVDAKADTEMTLRSHALEIERTIKDVVATSDAVTEGQYELSMTPSSDATRIISDSERASDKRRLEISEQEKIVELAHPTQTADFTGRRDYSEREHQESVYREFGSEESSHALSLSRIEAPTDHKEHVGMTKKISRTLSLERRLQATSDDQTSTFKEMKADSSEARIDREINDFYKVKSVVCLKAATEEKANISRHLSRSESELRAQRELHTSRDEILSSQKYKEFISEVQGLTTHWDVIETEQAALICWKEADQQSSQLLTKSVSEVDVGTTLDLAVRRPARNYELELPLGTSESVVRQLSSDDIQTSLTLQRSASEDVAESTAPEARKSEDYRSFHEYGEDSTATSVEFGKIPVKTHSHEDVTRSLTDVRKLVQVHSTMASEELEVSSEQQLRKASEIESSRKLVVLDNMMSLQQQVASTKETALTSTVTLGRQDSIERADIVTKEVCSVVQEAGRIPETKEEVASSQYETYENVSSDSKTIAVDNQARLAASMRAVEETSTGSSLDIERADNVQVARTDIPLKRSEMQERKFQIQMTKSEKHLERVEDEDVSEAINTLSVKELTSAKLHEYGDEKTQLCTLFGKITQKKYESDEAEASLPVPRRWLEFFSSKAAGDHEVMITLVLRRNDKQADVRKTVYITHDLKTGSNVRASSFEAADTTTSYSKAGLKESASIKLRGRSKERAEKKFLEQEWNLQSTASEWQTILNDLEAEVTKAQILSESFRFSTKAPAMKDASNDQWIARDQATAGATLSMSSVPTEKQLRAFSIDHEDRTLQIHHIDQDFAEIEQLIDEINQESGLRVSFREYEKTDSDSGITLVRRTLPKTRESCSHVVSVSTSLQQLFATQAATDDRRESTVELTLPSPSLKAEVVPRIARKERIALSTKHSTDIAVSTSANYNKCADHSSSTLAKQKYFVREKSSERFREAEDGAIEILSNWEGVERDLEAEVYLPKRLEVKSSLATFQTSEEVETLTKGMVLPEELVHVAVLKRVVPSEKVSIRLVIEECCTEANFVGKAGEITSTEVTLPEKILRKESWRLKESGDVKFNAVISLVKVDVQKPIQKQEILISDKICISAAPVYIKADAVETDLVWSDHHLLKTPTQFTIGKKFTSANVAPGLKIKTAESGDEKIRLAVELLGSKGGVDKVAYEWPLANWAEGIMLETEEFGDEHTVFYAQLSHREVICEEAEKTKAIPRWDGIFLRTKESKEEEHAVAADWSVAPQKEQFNKLICISNTGNNVDFSCSESGEEAVVMGVAFELPQLAEQSDYKWVDKRFGGDYYLYGKAATTEDRQTAVALVQKVQLEAVRHKQTQQIKSEICLNVTAASTEVITLNLSYEKKAKSDEASALRFCPNHAEPFKIRFLESLEEFANTYFNLTTKESSGAFEKMLRIPVAGDAVVLSCDAAEDVRVDSNPALSIEPQFAVVSTVVKDSNTTGPTFCKTFEPTSQSIGFATTYTRKDSEDCVAKVHEDVNRGSNITVTMKESREEKHTIYQQYEQEEMKETAEKMHAIAWFGGQYHLKTDASEEHEVIANRELEKVRDVIAHCEKKNIIVHRIEPLSLSMRSCSTINSVVDKVWKREDVSYVISKKIAAVNSESVKLRVEESAEFVEHIHPMLTKSSEKFDLDRTLYIAEQGGRHSLSTFAAGDKTVSYTTEFAKPLVKEYHTQIAILIANGTAPIELYAQSSKTALSLTSHALNRLEVREEVRKVHAASNQGIPAVFVARESEENGVIMTSYLRRDDSSCQEATVIDEKRYGGAVQLTTKFATDTYSAMGGTLLCPRPTDLSAHKVIVIGNSVSPPKLSTLACSEELRIVEKDWTRAPQQYTVSKKVNAPNVDVFTKTLREAGDSHETANCVYSRDSEAEQAAGTLKEKRIGGAVALSTKHSRECSSESDNTLVATRLALVSTEKVVVIANTIPGAALSTFASSVETQTINEEWTKPGSFQEQTVILKKPNIGEHVMVTAGETTSVNENIIIQLHRKGERADNAVTRFIPHSIEPTTISTKSSEDICVKVDSDLQGVGIYELDASIIIKDCNTDKSILYCECSKEASTSGVFNLTRLSDTQSTREVKEAANRGIDVAVGMRESSLVSEITSVVYERDESVASVSETVFIPREGGKYQLSTGHASEETMLVDKDWTKERVDAMEANITKVLRNEEKPLELFASATEDSAIGTTVQLQKTSQTELSTIKKDAPRLGEPVIKSIYESTSVEEVNNVHLGRDDSHMDVENIVKLAAYGGTVELQTSYAEENHTAITSCLSKPLDTITTEVIRTVSREESMDKYLSATSEEMVGSGFALSSGKSSSEGVMVTRIASNDAAPIVFNSKEAEQNSISTNYVLHREPSNVSEESTFKEARYGGGTNLFCSAASEISPDTVSVSLESRGKEEENSLSLKIAREETLHLSTKASTEESITANKEVLCTRISAEEVHETRKEARKVEPTALASRCSEETIFHLNYSYQKQPTEFMATFVGSESRDEGEVRIETEAARHEHAETEELSVSRRMVEVEVEGVVMRGVREASPLLLHTESASEYMVGVEQTLEKQQHLRVESMEATHERSESEERKKEEKR